MSEHDPILLRRLLELRRFPLFATAELGELAMLAENVVETTYESGAVIARPPLLGEVHLILSGQIDAGSAVHPAHGAFGVLEVLARRPVALPAVAVGETRTLRLSASDLREILEDNYGLMLLAIRELAARTLAGGGAAPRGRRFAAGAPIAAPLGLVERMIVLRHQAPFAPTAPRGVGADGLARSAPLESIALLAHASKETTWPAGSVMARADDPARDAYFLLDGNVRALRPEHESPGSAGARSSAERCGESIESHLLGPGGSIGVLEGLAGVRHAATVEVVSPVRALEISSSVIFDVLEDHPELGLSMIEALARGLLDAAAASN